MVGSIHPEVRCSVLDASLFCPPIMHYNYTTAALREGPAADTPAAAPACAEDDEDEDEEDDPVVVHHAALAIRHRPPHNFSVNDDVDEPREWFDDETDTLSSSSSSSETSISNHDPLGPPSWAGA